MHDEVRLDFGDAWIVGEIGHVLGFFDVPAVIGRQARDGPLQFAHRCQVLVQALAVGWTERRLQVREIFADRVEHALLASDPALITDAEEPIEQVLRDHFGRQRAVGARPTEVPMDVLAV